MATIKSDLHSQQQAAYAQVAKLILQKHGMKPLSRRNFARVCAIQSDEPWRLGGGYVFLTHHKKGLLWVEAVPRSQHRDGAVIKSSVQHQEHAAQAELATALLLRHGIQPQRRRNWAYLLRIQDEQPERLDGGYFFETHYESRGVLVKAVPRASRRKRKSKSQRISEAVQNFLLQMDDVDDDRLGRARNTVTELSRSDTPPIVSASSGSTTTLPRSRHNSNDTMDVLTRSHSHSTRTRTYSNTCTTTTTTSRPESINTINTLFTSLTLHHPKLLNLQLVLRALDFDARSIPASVRQCRRALGTVHVNIWDVVPAVRAERRLLEASAHGYGDGDEEGDEEGSSLFSENDEYDSCGRVLTRRSVHTDLDLARTNSYGVPRYDLRTLRRELATRPDRRFPLKRAKNELLRDLLRKI